MPKFVGGPLDGRELETRDPHFSSLTVTEYREIGFYALTEDAGLGLLYRWRVYGERPKPTLRAEPPKPSRRSELSRAASPTRKARKLEKRRAALAAKEAADARKIDAAIAAAEAWRAKHPTPNERVLWDGADTKYEATLHCPPPRLDAVGWLLDQPEWITPSLFLPRRGQRHAAT